MPPALRLSHFASCHPDVPLDSTSTSKSSSPHFFPIFCPSLPRRGHPELSHQKFRQTPKRVFKNNYIVHGSTERNSTRAGEQSRTRGGKSGGVNDRPQYPGLWRSRTSNARSLSRSPSSSQPPFVTQSPFLPRSLVRDGQTSPHRPRLVVSHSTRPPQSHYPPPPTRTAL